MRLVYLALTVWGAFEPVSRFLRYLAAHGWSLAALGDFWDVNRLVRDLTIAAIALIVWALAEALRRRDWAGLVAVPATLCVGVNCGLPLYLWLRSRR